MIKSPRGAEIASTFAILTDWAPDPEWIHGGPAVARSSAVCEHWTYVLYSVDGHKANGNPPAFVWTF